MLKAHTATAARFLSFNECHASFAEGEPELRGLSAFLTSLLRSLAKGPSFQQGPPLQTLVCIFGL